MQLQHKIVAGLFGIFMLLLAPVALANLLSPGSAVKTEYMETQRTSTIYSLIGDHVIPVGEVKPGQLIQVAPMNAEYYEITFGRGTGFIDKHDVAKSQKKHEIRDSLSELKNPLSNQNLITKKPTKVYLAANNKSEVFALLEENLRYPIIAKLKDSLNNTWFEVKIGDRQGYISEFDSEIDNGIPILTYHHLLKNEENKRFLNTSTTTSDVAFSNQMTYLQRAGYSTISMYQLEAYLNNRINLPGKVVVLTFDDGLKSVYRYAYPVLKMYGFQATAFIISSRIKRYPQKWNPNFLQFMSISELNTIRDVFDIQSHTHFLHRIDGNRRPILLSRSLHNIEFDFEHARRALLQFNPNVFYLSYPFGGYNQNAIQAAKNMGLHMAVTTVQGKAKPGDNLYTLKRLYILRTDSIQTMAERIANKPTVLAAK